MECNDSNNHLCHVFDGIYYDFLSTEMDGKLQPFQDAGNSKESVIYDFTIRNLILFSAVWNGGGKYIGHFIEKNNAPCIRNTCYA